LPFGRAARAIYCRRIRPTPLTFAHWMAGRMRGRRQAHAAPPHGAGNRRIRTEGATTMQPVERIQRIARREPVTGRD